MPDWCHYVRGKDRRGNPCRVLIPGCWGSVIYGIDQCTCDIARRKAERLDALERRLEKLEEAVRQLHAETRVRKLRGKNV